MTYTAGKLVYVGIKGSVLGIDRSSGQIIWSTKLKGSDFVNLVLDGDALLATARGELFCLDPASGAVKWNNPLPGFGWGLLTIATTGSSSPAALIEYQRRAAAAANSTTSAGATAC